MSSSYQSEGLITIATWSLESELSDEIGDYGVPSSHFANDENVWSIALEVDRPELEVNRPGRSIDLSRGRSTTRKLANPSTFIKVCKAFALTLPANLVLLVGVILLTIPSQKLCRISAQHSLEIPNHVASAPLVT